VTLHDLKKNHAHDAHDAASFFMCMAHL